MKSQKEVRPRTVVFRMGMYTPREVHLMLRLLPARYEILPDFRVAITPRPGLQKPVRTICRAVFGEPDTADGRRREPKIKI